MRSLKDILKKLSKDRLIKIKERTKEIISKNTNNNK